MRSFTILAGIAFAGAAAAQANLTNGGLSVPGSGGSGGGGISSIVAGTCLTGGTITTAGTIGLNSPLPVACGGSGTGIPGDVAGIGISVAGTWPSQTITNSGQTTPVSAGTGISITSGTIANTASLTASTNITLSGSAPNQTIAATGGVSPGGTTNSIQTNSGAGGLGAGPSFRIGGADTSISTAGTITAQNVLAGSATNTAGGAITLSASNGTGTGGSGAWLFQTAPPGSTGTGADTLSTVFNIGPSTIVDNLPHLFGVPSVAAAATAGSLIIIGNGTCPGVVSAEGCIGLSSGNGLLIEGGGSTDDIVLATSAGVTACVVVHSATGMNCGTISATTSVTGATGSFTTSLQSPRLMNGQNTHLWASGVVITLSGTGLGSTPSATNQNGALGGSITAGSSPANATFTITLAAATAGWGCWVNDETSNSSIVIGQTSHTTTTAVFQAYSRTTGLAAALNASDVLTYGCTAF